MMKINWNMDIKDIKLFPKNSAQVTGKIDYSSKKINLLPDNYYKRKRRKNIITIIFVGFFFSTAYFSFYLYQVKNITEWYNSQVNAVESIDGFSGFNEQIASFTNEKNSQDLIFDLKKRIDKKSSLLQEIENTNKSIVYMLEIIENELPDGITFQSLSIDSESSISISCEAESNKEIAELIYNLKKTNTFNDVFVSTISKREVADEHFFAFTIDCEFGGVENATN